MREQGECSFLTPKTFPSSPALNGGVDPEARLRLEEEQAILQEKRSKELGRLDQLKASTKACHILSLVFRSHIGRRSGNNSSFANVCVLPMVFPDLCRSLKRN